MIPFNCLTLSLDLDRTHYTLQDRLNAYSKLEKIEGVECPRCTLLKAKRLLTRLVDMMKEKGTPTEQMGEPLQRLTAVETALEEDDFDEKTIKEKCKISSQAKVTTTKTKQIVVARPPQSLAIHMNRSVFNPATFDMIKNSAPVRFPKTLDLGPWCLGSADLSSSAMTEKPGGGEEEWQIDPESSMVAGSHARSRLSGPIYELRAAVTHNGRHENGHYICYRRFPRNLTSSKSQQPEDLSSGDVDAATDNVPDETDAPADAQETEDTIEDASAEREKEVIKEEEMEWWRLSDHNVSKVDEEVVLSLSPGVFMLFYDCIDANTVHCETTDDEGRDAADITQAGKVSASTVEELRNEIRSSSSGLREQTAEPVLQAEKA
jgi:ubiquitin carboxyl-terminal hydrolase 1